MSYLSVLFLNDNAQWEGGDFRGGGGGSEFLKN